MCGITGVFAFNLVGKFSKINVAAATASIAHRGPDFHNVYADEWVCLGHRRLSIIDTREVSNQPMWDETDRYAIVYNGEIFNYKELRKFLTDHGVAFFTESDTEVLLKLFIFEGENCLRRLNGFFAFCIYDKVEQSLFLARDPFGIKPLLYLYDEDKFLFGSEMKAIVEYGIEKEIDHQSLYTYLQLNYIPAPYTIFSKVRKLLPGHCARVTRGNLTVSRYNTVAHQESAGVDYEKAKTQLRSLLDAAVQRWLISDVPLVSFLSGGIDSSVITMLASRHKLDLHTYSIGFSDEPYFDESNYAREVASHLHVQHTVFSLSNDAMAGELHNILDSTDEPFADSSSIAVYLLSRETRRHAKVALSGDGADELLGGYNKYAAFERTLNPGWMESTASALRPLWGLLPKSRHAPFSNKVRQLDRYSRGARLPLPERYWLWAGFTSEARALKLLSPESRQKLVRQEYDTRKRELLAPLSGKESLNDILSADQNLVLPNDMLTKVDRMSMAHGLEVRVPFLDPEVAGFISSLPGHYKVDGSLQKKILRDAFRGDLPDSVFNRPKKGFEVPLLKWLRKDMKKIIREDLLSEKLVREQGIFNFSEIRKLRRNLFSFSPGDVHARVWGLVVFQWWWKKYVGK